MIMQNEYLHEIKEKINDLDPQKIMQAGLDPNDFKKPEVIEKLWYEYQKQLTEYDIDDTNFAFDNSIKEVLGKSVLGIA